MTNETDQPAPSPPAPAVSAPDGAARPASAEAERPPWQDRQDRSDRSDRSEGPREDRGERRRAPRRRGCEFCRNKVDYVDYKDVDVLRYYVGDRAKMEPRRKVGTCARHQRMVSQAVKRARYVALMPYTVEHMRKTGFGGGRR